MMYDPVLYRTTTTSYPVRKHTLVHVGASKLLLGLDVTLGRPALAVSVSCQNTFKGIQQLMRQ